MIRLLPLLPILAISSCHPAVQDSGDAAIFKSKIVAAIGSAESIRLFEHSHRTDFPRTADTARENAPLITYRSKKLTREESAVFLQEMEKLPPITKDIFGLCTFAPHHTIQFISSGKTTSTMEICFECDQVKWDAADEIQPRELLSSLSRVIQKAGFQPHRDWKSLAEEAHASASTN